MTLRPLPSTIEAPVEHTLEAKRSLFVAHLSPAPSFEEADAVVARLRKQRGDARHHCTAMVIGVRAERQRSTDDGEPAGTAGAPMLEVLRHRDVTDVVVVVSRWFGGTLLGAGGLVRAYGGAVTGALERAVLVPRTVRTKVTLEVPHADAGRILAFLHHWAREHDAPLDSPDYGAAASLAVWTAPDDVPILRAELDAFTGGTLAVATGPTAVVDDVSSRPARGAARGDGTGGGGSGQGTAT